MLKDMRTSGLYSTLLSRRQFIGGVAALAAFRIPGPPECTLVSEQEEGPYYIDGAMLRSNIRENKPGVPLTLRIALLDARRCSPVAGASLDIWHCDAAGVYSGFTANGGDRKTCEGADLAVLLRSDRRRTDSGEGAIAAVRLGRA